MAALRGDDMTSADLRGTIDNLRGQRYASTMGGNERTVGSRRGPNALPHPPSAQADDEFHNDAS